MPILVSVRSVCPLLRARLRGRMIRFGRRCVFEISSDHGSGKYVLRLTSPRLLINGGVFHLCGAPDLCMVDCT